MMPMMLAAGSSVLGSLGGGGSPLGSAGGGAQGGPDTTTVETRSEATAGSGAFTVGGAGKLDTNTLLVMGAGLVALVLILGGRRR